MSAFRATPWFRSPCTWCFSPCAAPRPAVTYPRTLILAEPNTQATFVETYAALECGHYFTNAVTEIVAGESAVVDHYKVQLEGKDALPLRRHAGGGGPQRELLLALHLVRRRAGPQRRQRSCFHEGAEATLNGLYLVNGRQHVDNHTAIDHAKPHGTSHELYKGILDGQASAVFNGKIYRAQGRAEDRRQADQQEPGAFRGRRHQHQAGAPDLGRRRALHARRDHRADWMPRRSSICSRAASAGWKRATC